MFTFDGFTVRPIPAEDREPLDFAIAADLYHASRMDADFFMKVQPGEDSWRFEDANGNLLFWFKTSTAVRVAIQFPEGATDNLYRKAETSSALMRGLEWIEGIFRANRFREIIFDTEGPELANFAKRRLGFREAVGLLSKAILAPRPVQAEKELWERIPQTTKEAG